ncbi:MULTISPECIES: FAD-dependent oxidoreductase [Nonomuraea]|uniref:FAD-dependent oxidoreductase n=1 Tax=Nonomuraea TaxID=83681 RepID=UPI0033826954
MDVIVGGGVVGLSIAWRLARQGREVVVVDPSPARGASYAAAGMLAPISEVAYTEEPLLRLGVASLRRWPAFAAALAADAGLTTPGSDGPATTLTAQSDRSVSAPRTTTTPNTHAGQSGSAVPAEGTLPTSTHVVTPHGGTGRTSSAAPPASTHVVTPHGETGHAGSAPTGAGPAAASAVPGDGRFPAFDPSSAGGRRPSAGGEDGRAAASPWGFGESGEGSERLAAARAGLDLRDDGTLDVAFGPDDLAMLDEQAGFMEKLGLPVERLTGRECRRLEPMLAPSVRGGLLARTDAWVDPRRVTAALLAALERLGVPVVRARVTELLRDGDRVSGVRLAPPESGAVPGISPGVPRGREPETLVAERVVLAAGAWSGELADVPVRPVKGQIMRLRSPQPLIGRCVRGTVHGNPVYLVPRGDGELVVGATQEELGFDTRVTAGGVYELLRDARELVPGVTELEVADVVAGLRPGTPDNLPVVGPSGIPGLVLATGHHRGGVLLTPLTAAILEGEEADLATLCSPARFKDVS